jgi:N-acetylmuramoyl-L-alanine amidase
MTYKRLPATLPSILRSAGLTVVEVDGWQTRGRPARTGGFNPVGVLCHHTATGPKTSNASVVKLLVNGRSDLPGPLSQFGLARNGTVYIIASGRANHAGKARASGTVAAGDGNELYMGIEAFNNGVGEKWSNTQMEAYALLAAVLSVKITKNSYKTVRGHKETSVTGKIDPTFNMTDFRTRVAGKIHALTMVKPIGSLTGAVEPKHAPAKWSHFTHLDPAHYMDYYYAIMHAPKGGAVDVDGQRSAQGTMWALHWGTVGKNHLHDPKKLIASTRRINTLSDAEIDRLRSPNGKKPHKMRQLLVLAWSRRVRIELELKVYFPLLYIKKLLSVPDISSLHKAQLLQFKTLAKISGSISRLTPVQHAGGITILTFTDYSGKGISKLNAWPVVDYVRGTPKWR